ncbi:MAG: DUF3553 domain-containing protein [Clostridiales bacterium]|nr:DUF3553 domain-containing protein [Clostridiales bacterium]
MGTGKISGFPWHIEKAKKEHKRPCLFFRDEDHWCERKDKQCYRSVRCEFYQPLHPEQKVKAKETPKQRAVNKADSIVVGSVVRHHEYGKGVVQSVTDRTVTVRFEKAGLQTVWTDTCCPYKVETYKQNPPPPPKPEQKEEKQIRLNKVGIYFVGCHVVHKRFGAGIVRECFEDGISVEFEDFGTKTLILDQCKQNNLLTLVRFKP